MYIYLTHSTVVLEPQIHASLLSKKYCIFGYSYNSYAFRQEKCSNMRYDMGVNCTSHWANHELIYYNVLLRMRKLLLQRTQY